MGIEEARPDSNRAVLSESKGLRTRQVIDARAAAALPAVSKCSGERRNPTLTTVLALARALDVELFYVPKRRTSKARTAKTAQAIQVKHLAKTSKAARKTASV